MGIYATDMWVLIIWFHLGEGQEQVGLMDSENRVLLILGEKSPGKEYRGAFWVLEMFCILIFSWVHRYTVYVNLYQAGYLWFVYLLSALSQYKETIFK
jgi:hypothetical protein